MKTSIIAMIAFGLLTAAGAAAQEFANIEYLCCDWGPAMKMPTKDGEKPQFSETEEEVYFLKQVGRFTRGITGEQGKGINIYLCRMKPDGSAKTEIRELWRNPNYPIDTQAQSTWMDVNAKTRTIALSVVLGGSDITGMWTMNLDGGALRRIMTPDKVDGSLRSYGSPSWTPDGQWLVFSESRRGTNYSRIAKCDKQGGNRVYLTNGPVDGWPRVSPDGATIVYAATSAIPTQRGIWLMNADGTNRRRLPNPDDKHKGYHSGTYPAWSPDGKRILLTGVGLIDAESGKTLWRGAPMRDGKQHSWGWVHWGKSGIVGFNLSGILLTDNEIKESKLLGNSQVVECKTRTPCNW